MMRQWFRAIPGPTLLVLLGLLSVIHSQATAGVALSERSALRAAAVSGGVPPSITAPATSSTTGGLGFSIAASITDPDPSDSVTVRVTGAPAGANLAVSQVQQGMVVATLGGVLSGQTETQSYVVTWEAVDSQGLVSRFQSSIEVLPATNAGGDLAEKVRRLVKRRHEFGIPAEEVRDLGANALPHILAILRDSTSRKYWRNAVTAAGFLGLPEAFDSLHAFIWNRFSGDVDHYTFEALFRAQAVLGVPAPAKPGAIDYLIQSTDPNYWAGLPWHFENRSATELGLLMSGRSIAALSVIGDGRAVRALEDLSETPFDARQAGYVREGLARQRQVLERGWMAVREEVRRKSEGGQ